MWVAAKTAPSILSQSVIAIGLWTLTLIAFGGLGFFARKAYLRFMEDLKSLGSRADKHDERMDTHGERTAKIEAKIDIETKLAYLQGRQDVLVDLMSGIGPEYMQSIKDDTQEHCQAAVRTMERNMEVKLDQFLEKRSAVISNASKE